MDDPRSTTRTRLLPPVAARRIVAVTITTVLCLVLAGCKPSEKEVAAQRQAAVEAKARETGALLVKSNRANATALVTPAGADAAAEPAKATVGQTLSGLTPGRYGVTVHSEGWTDLHEETTVTAGQVAEVDASFPTGSLRLDSLPTGARVRWGNSDLGRTPLIIAQLPPGDCPLILEYPLWPALTTTVAISAGTETAATVRLPHGRLILDSAPTGAAVLLGQRVIGQTPLTIERFQAGNKTLTLQLKDFPPLEVAVAMEDQGETRIRAVMATGFPELDPVATLQAVWYEPPPRGPNESYRDFDPFPGFHPQGSVVRNLNRKILFEQWLGRKFRYTGTVKSFDPATGEVEFTEETSPLSKYRVSAKLTAAARSDPAAVAQLNTKGASFALYGRFASIEESERRGRPISFEFLDAEALP